MEQSKQNVNNRNLPIFRKIGRPLYNPDYVLTSRQKAFITAILITDGWISVQKGGKNPSVGFQNSKKNEALVQYFCLETIKKDFVKMYAVGSILLNQNSEKNVLSSSGAYVYKSLKGVSNKLYSENHSAEVQELIREWFTLLVLNEKFIKNGDRFIKNLISVVQTPSKESSTMDKPAQTLGRKSRKATKAVETTNDSSQTS